ncbi:hypothetical protein K8R30_01545 [archaeon]|nr:hypothetical protein [archaeon]
MVFEVPENYILYWQVPMFDKKSNIEEHKRKKMLFDSGSKLVNDILPRLEEQEIHCIIKKKEEEFKEITGICREAKTFGKDDYFIGPEIFNAGDIYTVSYKNRQ